VDGGVGVMMGNLPRLRTYEKGGFDRKLRAEVSHGYKQDAGKGSPKQHVQVPVLSEAAAAA